MNGRTSWALIAAIGVIFSASIGYADPSSSDYSITADSIDVGGSRAGSTDYSLRGSAVGGSGVGTDPIITNGTYTRKPGFVGQLYRLAGLSIAANPNSIDEATSRQLQARPRADDNTTFEVLDPLTIEWSIVNGPLTSVSPNGIVTAGTVYQDSFGIVAAASEDLQGELKLAVLNTATDDFGSYAGDQIDDAWQVQYFGQPPNPLAGPAVDADGTGQTNLFKFVAGLNPLDGSRFSVEIQLVPGHADQRNIIFTPITSGRTYVVQYQISLPDGSWQILTNAVQTDNGPARTVTDFEATDSSKLYRVQISKP